MNNDPESFSGENPYTRETMALIGLQLNVYEMHSMARRIDEGNKETLKFAERSTAHRYVMIDNPYMNKPLARQVVPVRTERILLLPNPDSEEEVKRIIVRIPAPAYRSHDTEQPQLRDAFIELVANNGRARFLLNNDGLWRYDNASEIFSDDKGNSYVLGADEPEASDVIESLSRYIAGSGYGLQTRFDNDY
jgi:hypothetical protein